MKKLFLFVAIVFVCLQCTQKTYQTYSSPTYKDKYADQLEPGSTLLKSWYHYTVEKMPTGEYVKKIFYPDTKTLTYFITYKDKNLTIKNGKYKDFWDDGDPINEGDFIDNKREGEWVYYSGQFTSKGQYLNNEKTGLWVTLDSVGNKTAEYNYLNSELHGAFKKWSTEGKIIREGNYIDGEIDWEKNYENEPVLTGTAPEEVYNIVEQQPYFKSQNCDDMPPDERKQCSNSEMLKYIYSNIKYPARARTLGLEGMVTVQFVVEKDGSISNVESKRGICKEMKDECLRIVQSMPAWSPGYQKDKPVRVKFYLPIKFKLE